MDRKEVSAILLKARETIESCDKTISEMKELHRKSAEELKRMSDVLSSGSLKFTIDSIPKSDKIPTKEITQGVSKVSLGHEEPEPMQEEVKEKRKSRRVKNSSLASMLKRNFSSANYDLSSLTYSIETLQRDEAFKREDAKIKPTPLILVDNNNKNGNEKNAKTVTKAQERRQSFGKTRQQKIR